MTSDELMFFSPAPELVPLYAVLVEKLRLAYPDMGAKVAKTQISFRNRHIFAMVSLPRRRINGISAQYLTVSFGLPYQNTSPRIAFSAEPYPGRWTHHVLVERAEDIDVELMAWLDEAYGFSMVK